MTPSAAIPIDQPPEYEVEDLIIATCTSHNHSLVPSLHRPLSNITGSPNRRPTAPSAQGTPAQSTPHRISEAFREFMSLLLRMNPPEGLVLNRVATKERPDYRIIVAPGAILIVGHPGGRNQGDREHIVAQQSCHVSHRNACKYPRLKNRGLIPLQLVVLV